MRMSSFFYGLKQGFKNIFRNKMFSLASIATMSACIFLFGLFYIIVSNFSSMLMDAEKSIGVSVYFNEGTTDERIAEIGDLIEKRVEVSTYEYITSDEAWDYVKEVYFEGKQELAAAFEGDNPVANSMHYNIYLSDVTMQDTLVDYLTSLDDVRMVKKSEMVVNTLSDFNKLVGYISVGVIAILLLVSVFLISNTVTTGISVRKEEIGIMKLIGATDFFVRAPFVVEGMIIGLVGALLPLGILYYLYDWIVPYVGEQFKFIGSELNFISQRQIFSGLIPIALLLGVGIGFIGSIVTVRKHLRV